MPALTYKGVAPTASTDLVTYDYVASLLGTELTTTQVNDRINANLAGKVLQSYVDTQDLLNATQAYVDSGDAGRLKVADKDIANGVLALGPSGRGAPGRFNVASTQRWNSGLWTPSTYGVASGVTAETGVYQMPISDPGFSYKLVVFGWADVVTNSDAEYPIVTVRDGSTSGTVIAEGRGAADSYTVPIGSGGSDDFERTTTPATGTVDMGPNWSGALAGGNSGSGAMRCDGHNAEITATDGNPSWFRARRTAAADSPTSGDYQEVTATLATSNGSVNAWNDLIFRINSANTHYVRAMIGLGFTRWHYSTGSGEGGPFNQVNTTGVGSADDVYKGIAGADGVTKKFTIARNGTVINTWNDSNSAATTADSSHRYWGLGGGNFGGGVAPPKVSLITIGDGLSVANSLPVAMIPINYSTQGVKTGATTLYVRANRSGSSAQIGVNSFAPSLVAFAIPA